jgi:hypothetical protein
MRAIHIPSTLANIGQILWGAGWMDAMASALGVTEREILRWDADPQMMPSHVEGRIRTVAERRLQEIDGVIARLDETILNGSRPNALDAASRTKQHSIISPLASRAYALK